MKFLHIADLHIGKALNDVSFLDDQQNALIQIVRIAESERVDAVLVAGDIYQKASPSAEAMAVFDDFITQLTSMGIKAFIISGNHDSSQRISYFASLIRDSGVYVSEAFTGSLQQVILRDAYGELVIHLLPFIKPSVVRRLIPESDVNTYQEAVEAVLANSTVDKSRRNVLLCHQFITGAEISDSEERMVGGLDQIGAAVFDDFDYVALGHLHKPQRVLRDTLRYAGSPLKYSFSETPHRKSATIVDMREKGSIDIKTVPIVPMHDMRLVEGKMADIMDMTPSTDYVWVTVNDELVPPDARLDVSTVFPNMMKFSISNSRTKLDADVMAAETIENKDVPQLFRDFYRLQNNDQEPTEAHMSVLESIMKRLEDRRNETN